MKSISELVKILDKKKTSERAELLSFFVDNLRDKNNKKYRAAFIGMKLAHIPTKDLYYFRSCCQDRMNRGENWQKYFWYSLRPQK